MEKIIEITKSSDEHKCLICCANPATIKMKINRPAFDDVITSFAVCSACLARMQKEIEICK